MRAFNFSTLIHCDVIQKKTVNLILLLLQTTKLLHDSNKKHRNHQMRFSLKNLQKLLENKLTTTIIYLHGWFSLKSDEWRSHSFFHFHYILRNCAWMVLRPYLSEQIFSGKRKRPPLAVSSSSLYIYMLEEKVIINAGSIEDALKK